MKKTLITLLSLAGVASAYTTTVTPLTLGGWTLDPNDTTKLSLVDGVLSSTSGLHWAVGTATQSISSTLGHATDYFACTTETDTLSFSFDMTNNGTGNGMITLALVGQNNAIVAGHGTYEANGGGDDVQVAVTDNVTANGYVFAATNRTDALQLTAGATLQDGVPTGGATTTISGTIAWDGDSYALTLGTSAVSDTITYDLGLTSVDVRKLVVVLEGGDNGNNGEGWDKTPSVTNLTITGNVIPEPTTATLSLLALAGLAARRRRK